KALDGQRYANLLDRFESTLEALASTQSDVSLKKLAGRELKKLGRDVDAAGLAGENTVVAGAKGFQDVLGGDQDSVVAEERLRTLAHEAPQDQAVAAGLLIARERASRERARRSWRKAWRALSS